MATRRGDAQPAQADELLGVLRAHLPELREGWAVRNLWAFGSFVRGEATTGSDLDLLVEFDRAPTLFEFVRLERHIRELLGVSVDLVMRTALKPTIGARILEEAVPV
ncbi:MAG: nucleotidyltransferase family protein [Armatimonadota bacterium]